MHRMTKRLSYLAAAALVSLAQAGVQIDCPTSAAGGSQTTGGDVFVVGQAAIGFSTGSHDLGQGAVECWFDVGAGGCPEDANGNGTVDITDLGIVLGEFGMSGAGLQGDLNGDGSVDITDLGMVLAAFGMSC